MIVELTDVYIFSSLRTSPIAQWLFDGIQMFPFLTYSDVTQLSIAQYLGENLSHVLLKIQLFVYCKSTIHFHFFVP